MTPVRRGGSVKSTWSDDRHLSRGGALLSRQQWPRGSVGPRVAGCMTSCVLLSLAVCWFSGEAEWKL